MLVGGKGVERERGRRRGRCEVSVYILFYQVWRARCSEGIGGRSLSRSWSNVSRTQESHDGHMITGCHRNNTGSTPLHLAAATGHSEVVKYLLEQPGILMVQVGH